MQTARSLTIGAALAAALAVGGIVPGLTSSHREAPLTAADPQIDGTDVYAFVSPDKGDSVTLISNWVPNQLPAGGPNFYPFGQSVRYDINIDNNGDAEADIVYRWTFTNEIKNDKTFLYNTGPVNSVNDPTLNFRQTYSLEEIRGTETRTLVESGVAAPSFVGAASMPDYGKLRGEAIVDFTEGSGRSFAGPADDPFFLDLRVFDLLYGTNLKEVGNDSLRGLNVNVLAVQVPKKDLAAGNDDAKSPIIGVWSTASRKSVSAGAPSSPSPSPTASGSANTDTDFTQVSRLGHPLVNEVVVPLAAKDLFNASQPKDDKQFLAGVQDPEVPKLIELIYKIKAPAAPRADLVEVFLTGVKGLNQPEGVTPSEMLRLNMSIATSQDPKSLGVLDGDKAGFPNGRRLTDDVLDIALQVMEGELLGSKNDLGDAVNENDVAFVNAFPYVALPHSGSQPLGTQVKGTRFNAPVGSAAAGEGGTATRTSPLPIAAAGILAGMLVLAAITLRRKTSA